MSTPSPSQSTPSAADAKAATPSTLFDLSTHTFLVSDEIALRPATKDDAAFTSSWRETRFPHSPETTETWIEEELSGSMYIVVRRHDGRPVGQIRLGSGFPKRFLRVFIDPVFGDDASRWLIAVYRLVLPWQIEEKHVPILSTNRDADETDLIAALREDGWRECCRYPQASWSSRSGAWVDRVFLELPSPQWLATMGDPADAVLERSGTGLPRPVVPPRPVGDDAPKGAVMLGDRVYLRPLEKEDALTISEWTRQEPDPVWSLGRAMYSPPEYVEWIKKLQKDDPQTWPRFAVCLRDTGELIGSMGIVGIDFIHGMGMTESELNNPAYREQGYGTEAKQLLFAYAFDVLGLRNLESWVAFPNLRSAAALRKQGYKEAGRLHWEYALDGDFGHATLFLLNADEWRALPRIPMTTAEPAPTTPEPEAVHA
ncbi:MAG: GNAT family N-acetyltransferase [Thermomicrobiales bacterium]